MTLTQVSAQLFDLSLLGYFNGEKFTKEQITNAIKHWMATGKSYIGEIALPDGRWNFEIVRYSDKADGFDYYIPETREQNERLAQKLMSRYEAAC